MNDSSHTSSEHGAAAAHGDGHHGSMVGTYVTVLLVLAFLTVIEIFVPIVYDAGHNGAIKMLLLVSLAFGKAMIVAWYFMHLKWEARWVRWVAAMPIYMGIFAVLLMLESYYRGVGIQG